jgi:hypothetical protein
VELLGGIVGAVIGAMFERIASLLQATFYAYRYRYVRGEYTHDNGVVRISQQFGYRFITEGRENDPANDWTGSFRFDDLYMHTARGAYRHTKRIDDWGYHYLRLLENGNLSVQWENVSGGKRNTGALEWYRRP